MKHTVLKLLSGLLCLCLLFGSATLPALADEVRDYSKFEEVYELYKEYFYVEKDEEAILLDTLKTLLENDPELFGQVMDALMKSGDPYSRYSPPETVQAEQTAKQYGGVGMTVQPQDDGRILVVELNPGGAAETAGIQIGDQITAIDGVSVLNLTPEAAVELGRGEVGTNVTYSMYRASTGEMLSFTMVREQLTTVTVSYEFITDEQSGETYAYCRINDFLGMLTYVEFVQFIKDLQNNGVDRILFDIRNNPGGDLNIVLDLINYLIPGEGHLITTVVPRDESQTQEVVTTGRGIETECMVILIDETTASAAELFAIALQEYDIAELVGKKTYGKAIGQQYFELEDGSEAIITAIQVTSPKGVKYNGVGVTPDYEVDNTEVPRELPDFIVFSHANYQQAVFWADNEVVEALEQRLVLLGVMREADSVFDQDTAQALAIYQKNMGLEQTGELDLLTFQSITDLVNAVKNVRYVHDDQLDKAVELITAP